MIMKNLLFKPQSDVQARQETCRLGLGELVLSRCLRHIQIGRLSVVYPSGTHETYGDAESGPQAELEIYSLKTALRMLISGDLGLAQGYMDGEWNTADLTSLLMLGARNISTLSDVATPSWWARVLSRLHHSSRANTRDGSRRNIAAHYDLGNAFYNLWLDESMTYSSGLFIDMDEPLAVAQRRKYLRLAEKLNLQPGDRVLEIGCGWGDFAEIAAAEYGCSVVGLTLSVEQANYARNRMDRVGLSKLVDIRIQDYRDVFGEFDKIVSIEMFEAVGEKNWETYFRVLKRCLKPGGLAALQVITIADSHYAAYRKNPDFIQRYIFPGGMLPSPSAFANAVTAADLQIADRFDFGSSYAETLRRWNTSFQNQWPAIEALGFDRRFRRMWEYYLCYCEVGMDTGQVDVSQFVIECR